MKSGNMKVNNLESEEKGFDTVRSVKAREKSVALSFSNDGKSPTFSEYGPDVQASGRQVSHGTTVVPAAEAVL